MKSAQLTLSPASRMQETVGDYKGKVAVWVFFNLACAGCIARGLPFAAELSEAYPEVIFRAIHAKFGSQLDAEDAVIQTTTDRLELPFPVLIDDNHTTYDAVGAEGTPHWIILNEAGEIGHSIFGSTEGSRLKVDLSLREMVGR